MASTLLLTPAISSRLGVQTAVYASPFLIFLSLLIAMVLAWYEQRIQQQQSRFHIPIPHIEIEKVNWTDVSLLPTNFWILFVIFFCITGIQKGWDLNGKLNSLLCCACVC